MLKRKIYAEKRLFSIFSDLQDAIVEAWSSISTDYINRLHHSIPSRLVPVVENDGNMNCLFDFYLNKTYLCRKSFACATFFRFIFFYLLWIEAEMSDWLGLNKRSFLNKLSVVPIMHTNRLVLQLLQTLVWCNNFSVHRIQHHFYCSVWSLPLFYSVSYFHPMPVQEHALGIQINS